MQRLLALFIPSAEDKLYDFVEEYKLYHRRSWDDGLRLTIPLYMKTPHKTIADLAILMEIGGLDKDWEFVTHVLTDDPDEFDPVVHIMD